MKLKGGADHHERIARAAWHLAAGGRVTTRWLRERFGVCRATAKRDMHILEQSLPLVATGTGPRERRTLMRSA